MFASFSLEDKTGGNFHIPKLNSKKSRSGCERCKRRHVKCDETKPGCKECKRHGVKCRYLGVQPTKRNLLKARKGAAQSLPHHAGLLLDTFKEPLDTKERRLLEARLMCQYVRKTGATLSSAADALSQLFFTETAFDMCFQNESLIYAMYSLAALDLNRGRQSHTPTSLEKEIPQRYLSLALRHHQSDLQHIGSDNIDAVCLTSCMVRMHAFALLQNRTLQPYFPPVEWLGVTRTSIVVFQQAFRMLEKGPDSITRRFLNSALKPISSEDSTLREYNNFKYLLTREPADLYSEEQWDAEVQQAYEGAVSYLASLKAAIKGGTEDGLISRRMAIFAMFIHERLFDLMQQGEPRSLAVLAHYFTFMVFLENIWWVGTVGAQEVRAIAAVLTGKWKNLIKWPVQVLEQWESGQVLSFHDIVL